MMRVSRTSLTQAFPFILTEAKALLRVEHFDEDLSIAHMAQSAALEVEHYAGVALLAQRIRVDLDDWPPSPMLALPVGPVDPFEEVAATAQGEAFTGFELIPGERPALRLTGPAPSGPLQINYQAGFGDSPHAIPFDLRLAVLQQTCAHFELRGASNGKLLALSPHTARIAARYRRVAL